jgi:Zn-dependent oligopeptidase
MTWIRTIRIEDADEKLQRMMESQRAMYQKEYASPVSPGGDSVVASHTLMPDALYHIFSAFGAMMATDLPLSRAQHEMIATMVSVVNRCFY